MVKNPVKSCAKALSHQHTIGLSVGRIDGNQEYFIFEKVYDLALIEGKNEFMAKID